LIAQVADERVRQVYGRAFDVSAAAAAPEIDGAQAVEFAKATLGYAGDFAVTPAARLVVLPHAIFKGEQAAGATLCYQVTLAIEDGTEATANHEFFIDAVTGEVIWRYNSLTHVSGTGHSLYQGRVTLEAMRLTNGNYTLVDGLRSNSLTLDMNNSETGVGALFIDGDNVWGNGLPTHRQSAAVDVHFGTQAVWDYYLRTFGRRSVDGNGLQLISRVHYGNRYNNAFWNGATKIVSYGDGDGVRSGQYVSLDTIGHELTHGVTQFSADLIYDGESGALNESFSDIFGTAVEFYAGRSPNYLMAEDRYTPNIPGDAVRDMSNPPRFDQPDHYDNRYTGTLNNGGVHINSGIQNKAFYLVAEGGTHPRSGVRVEGVGRAAAERIFYRALTLKLTQSATFGDARRATLEAAEDLYGPASREFWAVKKAWDAVGVGVFSPPCTACEHREGRLDAVGKSVFEPGGRYYYSASAGFHKGYLRRAVSDWDNIFQFNEGFDLYLYRWSNGQWVRVATGSHDFPDQIVSYYGPPGYYVWQIAATSKVGNYDLWLSHP
jgi:Zn-dependent metalloprotease